MTDNEIIKALEDCKNAKATCDCCKLFSIKRGGMHCVEDALDLINRQKAEIERLKTQFRYLDVECERLERIEEAYENLKKEKEQLEKDKENLAYSFANAVGQKMTAKAEAIKGVAAELYNSFAQYETYDRHHTFEILDRINSVEEFCLTTL